MYISELSSPVYAHFYELSKAKDSSDRTIAITEEVSNLMSYITRAAYAIAVSQPSSKAYAISAMAAVNRICRSPDSESTRIILLPLSGSLLPGTKKPV